MLKAKKDWFPEWNSVKRLFFRNRFTMPDGMRIKRKKSPLLAGTAFKGTGTGRKAEVNEGMEFCASGVRPKKRNF